MNIVSPTLSMGLPTIAVSPRQPPQPYLRHGYGSVSIALVHERMGGHRHRVEDTMMMQSVGDAPVVVSPALSIGDA